MKTFQGKLDPNAILRGETFVQKGDTFIQCGEDSKGFSAMVYEPKTPEPQYPYMHFRKLAYGTFETCEAAAKAAL